jgi:hypothetical protein
MYDPLGREELGAARLYTLITADDVVRSLDCCPTHRDATLFALAVLGWTEEAFLEAAYGQYLDNE